MKRLFLSLLLGCFGLVPHASAVNFTNVFSENFDSMGTAGTAPPTGWSLKQGASSPVTSNTTWTTTIPTTGAGSVPTMIAAVTPLTASSAPTANNNNGYNAQGASSADRVLATAPTTGAGSAIELTLTNTSGSAISTIAISYDTRRFTQGLVSATPTNNELPGYWLFYSLDNGTTWTNVSTLNPTITTVPNTVGVTSTPSTAFSLSSAWANNGTLLLRWVDDNAQQTSPDQIIGLDNVSITTNLALAFNGSSQYVTMGAATSTLGTSTFTLECWFKRTGTGVTTTTGSNGLASAVPLVTKGRGEGDPTATTENNVDCNYFMGIDSTTNKLCADFEAKLWSPLNGTGSGNNNYPVLGSTVLANNTWYHAAATWENGVWKLYINGVLETMTLANQIPTPAPVPQNNSIQHFGIATAMTSTGAAAGFFQGYMDEVRVWSVARSAAQILAARDLPVSGSVPGLLARYGFGEGSGTTTAAIPATAPNGTLTAAPTWGGGPTLLSNSAPTVALTAPASGATVVSGSTVTFTATATDSDGGIAKVEFFQGSTLIGTASTSPYSFSWTSVPVGTYSLTAKATDYLGAVTTSASVTLNVITNAAPTIALTAPVNNASVVAPATVNITASASDTDGSIAKVEFYNGATKLGQATVAPYSYNWTGIATGDYTLTAVATDDLGATTTSSAVTLHVTMPPTTPPTVSLTGPADGANFIAPATINLTANAADSDGTVAKVEFYNGATKLGQSTTAPYALSWTGVGVGDYVITAKATDDQTATTTSTAVTVHVLANQAPVLTLNAPTNNATGISSSTNLQLGIADPEGDAQTVTYYGRNTPPAATSASDFSFVAVPDTQFYSENIGHNASGGSAGATSAIYYAQMQWIVDNQAARKIAFVSHMGDIAQNGDTYESEWIVADTAMKKI